MARDPDLNNRGHIDPGDPPTERYPAWMGPTAAERGNRDPINADWKPGSVEDQRRHYRPEGGATLGMRDPHENHMHIKSLPVREGPDYANVADEEIPTLRITVGIPTRERTMRIMRGPATGALLEFMRKQQAYQNTDEALGAQGQFAEIYHDTAKLKRMIWDRRNPQSVTVGEVQETLMSLIGHALLAMDLVEEGNKDGQA